MFRPSHQRNAGFYARRNFTDREEFTAAFRRSLAKRQGPNDYRVLVFHGLGGQGKTELMKQFLMELKDSKLNELGYAAVDFELSANRDPVGALLALRLQLAKSAGIRFPAFDYAFAKYHMTVFPGVDIRKRHPELFSHDSDLLPDLISLTAEMASMTPVVGFFSSHLARFAVRVREWWERRGKSVLQDIDEKLPHDLVLALPTYFGDDVYDAMFGPHQPPGDTPRKRIVIMLDTYEALWRDFNLKSGEGSSGVDDWVRKLIIELPGVLFILFGRDALSWAETEPGWEPILEQHQLGELSLEDSKSFLRGVPIEDEQIIEQIVASSKGLPFYLDLLVSVYEKLQNDQVPPELSHFKGSGYQIIDRFLQHLDGESRMALRVLCHARKFDEALFLSLRREHFVVYTGSFADITRQSFFHKDEHGQVYMHLLMREHLRQLVGSKEPELSRSILQYLFDHFEAVARIESPADITPERAEALAEAAHYKNRLDPASLGSWLLERVKPFSKAGHLLLAEKLYSKGVEATEAMVGPSDPATLSLKSALAGVTRRQGYFDRSWRMHRDILERRREVLGEDHPETLSSMAGVAIASRLRGDTVEALRLQEDILERRKRLFGANDPSVANSLISVGISCRALGKLERAVECHEEALRIRTQALGERHQLTLSSMNNLAISIGRLGRTRECLALHEEVLRLRREVLGDQHDETIKSMTNVAALHARLGDHEKARILKEEALALRRQVYGNNDHMTTATMISLATSLRDTGRLEEAEALALECLEIRYRLYGERHRRYSDALANLAKTLREMGRLEEASSTNRRVIEIRSEVLGPKHPSTLKAVDELGRTFLAGGDLEEAARWHTEAIELRTEVLGHDHPYTVVSRYHLALVYKTARKLHQAKTLLEEVVAARLQRYGADAPGAAEAAGDLMEVLEVLGDATAASEVGREFGLVSDA